MHVRGKKKKQHGGDRAPRFERVLKTATSNEEKEKRRERRSERAGTEQLKRDRAAMTPKSFGVPRSSLFLPVPSFSDSRLFLLFRILFRLRYPGPRSARLT